MSPAPPTEEPLERVETVWSTDDLTDDPHTSADKAERVRRMFGAIAPRYDLNNRLHSFWLDQRWRRRAVALSDLRRTDDVLDAACGTGDLTEAFAAAGPASVIGVDFAEPMLELARAKSARRRRRRGGVVPTYRLADVTKLPFEDRSFDVVSIAFGIRNVDQPGGALGEFHRVLRPGGRLVVLEFDLPRQPILRALSRIYCERLMPMTATIVAGDRTGAYRYLPRSVATFADRDTLGRMLEEVGFARITVRGLTFGVCAIHVGRRPPTHDERSDHAVGASPSSRTPG